MYNHPLNKLLQHIIQPTDGMMFDCICYRVHAVVLMWGYPLAAWQAQILSIFYVKYCSSVHCNIIRLVNGYWSIFTVWSGKRNITCQYTHIRMYTHTPVHTFHT